MKHDETIWKNNDQQHATLRLDICCLNWYCMVFQEQNINRFQAVQGTLRHGCGTSLTSTIKLPFYLGTNLLDVLKNPMNKGGYSTYKNPMNKWGHSTYKNPMNKWGYSTYTYIYVYAAWLVWWHLIPSAKYQIPQRRPWLRLEWTDFGVQINAVSSIYSINILAL